VRRFQTIATINTNIEIMDLEKFTNILGADTVKKKVYEDGLNSVQETGKSRKLIFIKAVRLFTV
jgi:hypothetical protein